MWTWSGQLPPKTGCCISMPAESSTTTDPASQTSVTMVVTVWSRVSTGSGPWSRTDRNTALVSAWCFWNCSYAHCCLCFSSIWRKSLANSVSMCWMCVAVGTVVGSKLILTWEPLVWCVHHKRKFGWKPRAFRMALHNALACCSAAGRVSPAPTSLLRLMSLRHWTNHCLCLRVGHTISHDGSPWRDGLIGWSVCGTATLSNTVPLPFCELSSDWCPWARKRSSTDCSYSAQRCLYLAVLSSDVLFEIVCCRKRCIRLAGTEIPFALGHAWMASGMERAWNEAANTAWSAKISWCTQTASMHCWSSGDIYKKSFRVLPLQVLEGITPCRLYAQSCISTQPCVSQTCVSFIARGRWLKSPQMNFGPGWTITCAVNCCNKASVLALTSRDSACWAHPYATPPVIHVWLTRKCAAWIRLVCHNSGSQPTTIGRTGNDERKPTPVCFPPVLKIDDVLVGAGAPCDNLNLEPVCASSAWKRAMPGAVRWDSLTPKTPCSKSFRMEAFPLKPVGLTAPNFQDAACNGPGWAASPILHWPRNAISHTTKIVKERLNDGQRQAGCLPRPVFHSCLERFVKSASIMVICSASFASMWCCSLCVCCSTWPWTWLTCWANCVVCMCCCACASCSCLIWVSNVATRGSKVPVIGSPLLSNFSMSLCSTCFSIWATCCADAMCVDWFPGNRRAASAHGSLFNGCALASVATTALYERRLQLLVVVHVCLALDLCEQSGHHHVPWWWRMLLAVALLALSKPNPDYLLICWPLESALPANPNSWTTKWAMFWKLPMA